MFHDWSIIKLGNLLDGYIFAVHFENYLIALLIKFTGVAEKKRILHSGIVFIRIFLSCRGPPSGAKEW